MASRFTYVIHQELFTPVFNSPLVRYKVLSRFEAESIALSPWHNVKRVRILLTRRLVCLS